MPELLARAALGLGAGPAGFEVELMDLQRLDEASAGLPEEHLLLRALVLARHCVAATMIDSGERRLTLAHEALQLVRQARDDAAQAYALSALSDVFCDLSLPQ